MKKAIFLLFIVITYKTITNIYCYFRIKSLNQKHLRWIADKEPTFPTYKNEVISLFKKAGIKNIYAPTAQPIGYNRIASFNADVFTNFPSTNLDIFNGAIRMFYEAEGVYRHRIFETFSPMYWVDTVLFAPKNLLKYLGFDENKTLFKICNILLTFIWWVLGIFISFYNGKINDFITILLRQLNQ